MQPGEQREKSQQTLRTPKCTRTMYDANVLTMQVSLYMMGSVAYRVGQSRKARFSERSPAFTLSREDTKHHFTSGAGSEFEQILLTMEFPRNLKKYARKVSTPGNAPGMPLRRSKRPSVVDGKVLEPEWDQVSQTHGSFNQDILSRIAQAQTEHDIPHPTVDLPRSQSSSPGLPPRSSSLNWGTSMDPASLQQLANRRYYNNALSGEDRTALAIGDLNHNLREWTGDRLVQYHVSRIELVPYTNERQEIIAEILDEKRGSERFVLTSARQAKHFVSSLLSVRQMFEEMKTHNKQTRDKASRSMVDLRAASTPSLLLSPTSPASPISPKSPTSRDYFHFHMVQAHNTRQNTRGAASNNGDYFSRQSVSSSMLQSPHTSESSRDSSRNRGRAPDRRPLIRKADRNGSRARPSLAPEALPYLAKADVTFDTFLAPHVSGKGETHRDSIYIKKEERPRNFSRRLSKMPSTPQLKKRASQAFNLG